MRESREEIFMVTERVILASGSPRRKELLEQVGIPVCVCPSQVEEKVNSWIPYEVVLELSSQKAEEVASRSPADSIILGADTVVASEGNILGKPKSHQDAAEMIAGLQGKTHEVYTGVTLIWKGQESTSGVSFYEKTEVSVFPMTPEEIREYADSKEPMDKAGAYGIQGRFAAYIQGISGDYNNVVGLPIGRVCQELKKLLENTGGKQND